ncbi:MAG: 4Fe-4S dicluster domain-containing protein [Bacteroidales bacterium]|jgi:ferredoxin|nr:4Fe-4S dicluster domain-containing protein [Bacteroidales bacterium]
MRSSSLKVIRVFVALIFLLLTTFIFIDFRDLLPDKYYKSILYLQFVPSLISFLKIPVLAGAGFLIVLILTFLTGRTYCSMICPLGIFQDVVSRIGGSLRKKNRRFGFGKPFTVIRYGILGLTLAFTLFGGIYLVTLLDPYSIFGRFGTFFFKPVVLYLNNLLAGIVNRYDVYSVYKVDIKGITALAYVVPSAFLFLVGAFSFRKGRLYCNTVCPVGTLLGLISKVSLLRIRIEESDCSRCGRCAIACKASCIDFLNKSVDLSRCVACFNCLKTCPDKAIVYGLPVSRKPVQAEPDRSKREFISGIALLLLGIGRSVSGKDTPIPQKESTVRENRTLPVCMPGATSLDHFNANCTACSLCVSACPKDVIQPSLLEYGITGMLQPRMDYHKGFCNYECTICTEICPTGALMPLELEAKKLTQLGVAVFIKDNCIVHTEKTDCGACSEHCPTKAVHMVPYEGTLVIPEVTDEICIGCGACEYACPTKPYKAIFVEGNSVHIAAKKPETEQAVLKTDEFPF